MKKPDNIVYNDKEKKYDSFKKNYPTNLGSSNFKLDLPEKIQPGVIAYFKQKEKELKKDYMNLLNQVKWCDLVYNSDYSFQPIIGKHYYLYKGRKNNFLPLLFILHLIIG